MKGKIFTQDDLPKRLKPKPESITKGWLARQTARYRVVAVDKQAAAGDEAIIAEELHPRILASLPAKARRIVPMILRMPVQDRLALLRAFDESGVLRNPFSGA